MQTFLPYPDFYESAMVLDKPRLGKQRVENLQIMGALLTGRGWIHHPATRMWRGYEYGLLLYQDAVTRAWYDRFGFVDTCMPKTMAIFFKYRDAGDPELPTWLGDEDFHLSHQSNLVRKDAEYYGPLFPGVPDDLPYIWPVQKDNR